MTSDFSAAVEKLNAAKIRRNFGTAKFSWGNLQKLLQSAGGKENPGLY